jgi:CBS domain-containing protein
MTTVRDVMTSPVDTTTSAQTLAEAAERMRRSGVGSLPVVDEGQLVGMLTDRDIVTRGVAEKLDPIVARVGSIVTEGPIWVSPDQALDEALTVMAQHQVRRLPVVEEGAVVGMVAQADVALKAPDQRTGQLVHEISRPS